MFFWLIKMKTGKTTNFSLFKLFYRFLRVFIVVRDVHSLYCVRVRCRAKPYFIRLYVLRMFEYCI